MRSPVPIFDCHGHLGTHPDFPAWKQASEDMLQVMDLLNIEVLAITSTLSLLQRLSARECRSCRGLCENIRSVSGDM